jgi:hypothetical protein
MISKLYKLAALHGDADVNWNDHHLKVVARLDDSDIDALQLPSAVYPPHEINNLHPIEASPSYSLGKVGICAMENKALSKSNQAIFHHLKANNAEIVLFGDDVLLNQPVEAWPTCDFLIAFYSDGFPLEKAISYIQLRSPILCNDLLMQKLLFDRRLCLHILNVLGIRTPKRLEVSRDGGPSVTLDVVQRLYETVGLDIESFGYDGKPSTSPSLSLINDGNTLLVDGRELHKPFVEKPANAEDHNIYIYYPTTSDGGGGGRRLFRRIGNKCSEFDPELSIPRCITEEGTKNSYIYEPLLAADSGQDVKAYTVGPYYCLAVTRKSPAVTGIVHRNANGKEVRQATELTREEADAAAIVSVVFGQALCGFDIIRNKGKSYVIDVNGWTSVKNQPAFYGDCAYVLLQMMIARRERDKLCIIH